jgi:nitroreductase/NAD-dependent dihydropyrimidine dehydrogenase PreA subunit
MSAHFKLIWEMGVVNGGRTVALLEVNKQTCTQCGICADVCVRKIIYWQENSYPRLMPEVSCLKCGHCVAACPSSSLIHNEMPLEQSPQIDRSLDITFEQCRQLIKARRSVRAFKDKKVSASEIERIIDVARYGPTGHNAQEVQWLVISDSAKLKELSAIATEFYRRSIKKNPASASAPILKRTLKRQESGEDVFLHGAPAVVVAFAEKNSPLAAVDCSIALAYFDLAAISAGLGCCWGGLFMFGAGAFPPMLAALALPDGYTPYGNLMVGYPKYQFLRIPVRKDARINHS